MNRIRALAIFLALLYLPGAGLAWTGQFIEDNRERLEFLFASLDPDNTSMAPILRAWENGHQSQAVEQLDQYFAGKSVSPALIWKQPAPADLLELAKAARHNRFLLLEGWVTVPENPDGGLDWQYRGRDGDKEVAWMLNRHAALAYLAEAATITSDDGYRTRLNGLLQDWILHNPYPSRLTFSAAWRPLEVARRILHSWPAIFYGDPELLDPETRVLMLCSILEHGDALRNHASFWGGNHLITEKLGLLTLALAWPEFTQSGEWRAYALNRISGQFLAQTYPDGSYKELSNHYQLVVLQSALQFARLLELGGTSGTDTPVFRRIETMLDYFAGVMKPDGFGPLNNDSDLENNAALLSEAWQLFKRTDWLAMATNGLEGTLPKGPPSRYFPWAGQVVMRGNWGRQSDWVFFDAGPFGSAHQHVDRLHLSATLKGRPVLTDSGRHTYQPGQLRDFFAGPHGHSTLLLDGQPADQGPRITKQPLPVEFADAGHFVFAAATARFPARRASLRGPVPWTRAVLYDKRGFVIILDHLVSFASHSVQANWQFHPDVSQSESTRYLRAGPSSGPDWEIESFTGSESPPLGGFYSPQYNEKVPATRMICDSRINQPTTFSWILRDPAAPALSLHFLGDPGSPVARFQILQEGRIVAEAAVRLHPHPELVHYLAR